MGTHRLPAGLESLNKLSKRDLRAPGWLKWIRQTIPNPGRSARVTRRYHRHNHGDVALTSGSDVTCEPPRDYVSAPRGQTDRPAFIYPRARQDLPRAVAYASADTRSRTRASRPISDPVRCRHRLGSRGPGRSRGTGPTEFPKKWNQLRAPSSSKLSVRSPAGSSCRRGIYNRFRRTRSLCLWQLLSSCKPIHLLAEWNKQWDGSPDVLQPFIAHATRRSL